MCVYVHSTPASNLPKLINNACNRHGGVGLCMPHLELSSPILSCTGIRTWAFWLLWLMRLFVSRNHGGSRICLPSAKVCADPCGAVTQSLPYPVPNAAFFHSGILTNNLATKSLPPAWNSPCAPKAWWKPWAWSIPCTPYYLPKTSSSTHQPPPPPDITQGGADAEASPELPRVQQPPTPLVTSPLTSPWAFKDGTPKSKPTLEVPQGKKPPKQCVFRM